MPHFPHTNGPIVDHRVPLSKLFCPWICRVTSNPSQKVFRGHPCPMLMPPQSSQQVQAALSHVACHTPEPEESSFTQQVPRVDCCIILQFQANWPYVSNAAVFAVLTLTHPSTLDSPLLGWPAAGDNEQSPTSRSLVAYIYAAAARKP